MKDQVDQLQATAWRRRALTRRKPASSNLKCDRLSHRANPPALYRAGTPDVDNFLEHLAHWNPVLLAVDERTVSPNGATISARNTLPSVSASAFSDAAVYGADCHRRRHPRQDIVRLLGLNDPLIQISSLTARTFATC